MNALRDKWIKGYKPYHAALRKLKLPRRYKTRDPRNIRRVLAVCNTLHAVKLAIMAKRR